MAAHPIKRKPRPKPKSKKKGKKNGITQIYGKF